MWRICVRLLGAAALAAVALLGSVGLASAHEHRDVGDYTLVVGFLQEPTIEGEPNGLSLTVTQHAAAGAATPAASPAAGAEGDDDAVAGAPVTGLANTLKAEVTFGSQTMPLTLEPVFGKDGAYQATFIPTAVGTYSFHIFGTINGTNVDEKFTSGPDTFDDVAARATMEFPAAGAATDNAAAQAKDDASSAKTLAIVGIVIGALGVIAGGAGLGMALSRGKRAS